MLRYHHCACRTEQTCCDRITRYICFYHYRRHPKEMGKTEIEAFLSRPAAEAQVSAPTQRHALNAID